ncbi:MAG: glycoside hydrolase family 127 protein [Clostridia bacterium]|nr:glycoside hydrolase family 127 protein [Clostridia bacterium]
MISINRLELDVTELSERIALNRNRLYAPYYQIDQVFHEFNTEWPGDKEGRALLAFVDHYKMTGDKNPCMEAMLRETPKHLNDKGYFGPEYTGEYIFEQQLSGHSWMLRGLCEHYEAFGDDFSMQTLKNITENLFLPTKGYYGTYPVNREHVDQGGVGGNSTGIIDGWKLSTDIGCAFMSVDGLSHVYKLTRDERVLELLDEMIEFYVAIDKVALRVQTHCTLTAARGAVRLYRTTGNEKYLDGAKKIYDLYVHGGGMSAVYQNLNWWGRPDTWTEPCAIVDSLILAGELYRITGDEEYRTTAARVWHNGFASAQRPNGGAGPDWIVLPDICDSVAIKWDEAAFCCSMRWAEGLWYAFENKDILYAELELDENGERIVRRDRMGRYMCGDIIYSELVGGDIEIKDPILVDGRKLSPIEKYYRFDRKTLDTLKQKVIFN